MEISDDLYGTFTLETVLEKLIHSAEVQRLKDIHMIGPSYLLNPLWNETRYEHSIGVMLLIRKLGGSLEEQIAGLLHDVSHTIFSHVIDLVMNRKNEDYHEEIKQDYIENSSIPSILNAFGFDYKRLLFDDAQWPILEQEAPLLCADRLDYTLRENWKYFNTELSDIHKFLADIELIGQRLLLRTVSMGEWFIDQYYRIVLELFYDPLNMYAYDMMSQILEYALTTNYLTTSALMSTETAVLQTLTTCDDDQLGQLLTAFFAPVSFQEVTPEQPYDIYQKKKQRLIDPLINLNGQAVATSACSAIARKHTTAAKEASEKGVYLIVQPAICREN